MTVVLGLLTWSVFALGGPAPALANTSHAGWPVFDGMLLINSLDQPRPLDGRPGTDPWDGTDNSKSCPVLSVRHNECVPNGIPVPPTPGGPISLRPVPGGISCSVLEAAEAALSAQLGAPPIKSECSVALSSAALVPPTIGHNELLGGGGNDVIHAGPAGDVIWGDLSPTDQPASQVDYLYGGPGNDFIYASHGTNYIYTGGGTDIVHAHFGHGEIHCGSPSVTVYISRATRTGWKLFGCTHVSYATVGY